MAIEEKFKFMWKDGYVDSYYTPRDIQKWTRYRCSRRDYTGAETCSSEVVAFEKVRDINGEVIFKEKK